MTNGRGPEESKGPRIHDEGGPSTQLCRTKNTRGETAAGQHREEAT